MLQAIVSSVLVILVENPMLPPQKNNKIVLAAGQPTKKK